ncbi:MAG: hypothetical protein LBG60_06010, partial [Bifidobacteriaceae bacterium]|nr:hypothetical protein [Bifidobacteriaceae bacterium]
AAGAAPPPAGLSPADESALAERFNRARSSRRLTHEVIDAVATTVMRGLDGELKAAREQAEAAVGGILQITDQFAREWPADASGLVPGLVDAAGFCAILDRLVADRLPEFEKRFSDLLHTQAQQNIAQLSSTIRRAHREIREAVGSVNRSLTRSHFDVGRYLRINVKLDRPRAAEDFLADLKDIASGSWSDQSADDPAAAEAKYNVMAGIMTRLGSGEPADLRWRELCLDTRRHVRFSGEELDESGAVTAVHESGSGLSGGQQQKLAIFCLAAALRFQLAPEDGAVPNYGTVILDEAFDRADVDFTRMAMDIFVAFGFHMVLATPLKLIQTLEPYIGGIGVVSCRDRRQSTVAPVTMENALAAEVGAGAPAADAAVAG